MLLEATELHTSILDSNVEEVPVFVCHSIHAKKTRRRSISDALPFGRLWYDGPNAVANAVGYAEHYSRSHDAVIRVYDAAGNVIAIAVRETRSAFHRAHNQPFSVAAMRVSDPDCSPVAIRAAAIGLACGEDEASRFNCCSPGVTSDSILRSKKKGTA